MAKAQPKRSPKPGVPRSKMTPDEVRAWIAEKQRDPEFMAMIRESIEALDRGEGSHWEDVKRSVAARPKRKRA